MVRRLRRLPPPPAEKTLLVKDDIKEGGLKWKKVGDIIDNAKNAGQIINASNADKATTSTNVENIIATEETYPNIISFSIGDKSYSKTVNNVENAKAINRNVGNNEEAVLLHAEGSTDGFNLKWASSENAGTLTIETIDNANSQIRFFQNGVQVLQAINGKCSINGIEFIYNTNGVLQDKNNKIPIHQTILDTPLNYQSGKTICTIDGWQGDGSVLLEITYAVDLNQKQIYTIQTKGSELRVPQISDNMIFAYMSGNDLVWGHLDSVSDIDPVIFRIDKIII